MRQRFASSFIFVSTFALILISFSALFLPTFTHAAALQQDSITTVRAKVTKIDSSSVENIAGTDTQEIDQNLEAEVLEGPDAGSTVFFDNDYIALKVGDEFYLTKTISAETNTVMYSVSDPYRVNVLYFFIGLFVLLVIIFGGKQGVRGLVSLAGSLVLILYVLLPGILHGYSPILLSIGVSSLIIIIGSYVTHGFNKTTSAAVVGMIITIGVTGLLAHFAIQASHLTGFDNEESVYLNFDTNGTINFVGLLLGGMLIGLLGVLYDAAIGQAIAVEELHQIAPHISRRVIFTRAIRIGKEHIGALVNTLAIAYVGVSLPLLLLFSTSRAPFLQIVNKEVFATEIIRTMIGSIGLVLAVPITTLLAVFILVKVTKSSGEVVHKEEKELDEYHHHH